MQILGVAEENVVVKPDEADAINATGELFKLSGEMKVMAWLIPAVPLKPVTIEGDVVKPFGPLLPNWPE